MARHRLEPSADRASHAPRVRRPAPVTPLQARSSLSRWTGYKGYKYDISYRKHKLDITPKSAYGHVPATQEGSNGSRITTDNSATRRGRGSTRCASEHPRGLD